MKRETKIIPEVVFNIELFEVAVFKLAKVVVAVDPMTKFVKVCCCCPLTRAHKQQNTHVCQH